MFRLKDKICNIHNNVFYTIEDGIIFQSKNSNDYFLSFIKDSQDLYSCKLDKYISQICLFTNNIVIIYNDGDFDELNKKLERIAHKKKKEIKLTLKYIGFNHKDNLFICYTGDIYSRKAGVYDFLNDSVLFLKQEFFPWMFIEGKLIGKTNEKVILYNYLDGSTKWKLDVTDLGRHRRNSQSPEEEGKIEKIIGVYNDLLIVTITNSTVLAIDIHTGALKGKWRDLPEGQSYGKNARTTLVYPFQSFIDQTAGKLIGLIGSYYWEIDLYGDTIYLHDATEEFDKHQVGTQTSGHITPQGEHIFFASQYILPSAAYIQKVAAFNRTTKQIDWFYTFEDLAPTVMPKAPVVEGDRLYVLDTGGTLHIFERDVQSL